MCVTTSLLGGLCTMFVNRWHFSEQDCCIYVTLKIFADRLFMQRSMKIVSGIFFCVQLRLHDMHSNTLKKSEFFSLFYHNRTANIPFGPCDTCVCTSLHNNNITLSKIWCSRNVESDLIWILMKLPYFFLRILCARTLQKGANEVIVVLLVTC